MAQVLLKNGMLVTQDKTDILDILIDGDKISGIGKSLKVSGKNATVIDAEGKLIYPGFIDTHVHLRQPGEEQKEDLSSGLSAAIHGGITAVCSMPNTRPVIDNEFLVKFLVDKAWEISKARLYPIGSITKGQEGKELSEMASMIRAGAVAFSDDGLPLENLLVLRRALQYLKPYRRPLILHCENQDLTADGVVNEGAWSTRLGLPGIHPSSEETYLAAAIEVAKYFGHVHIAHVSTRGSVELIRFAKKRGIPITAETCPHYFILTEEAIAKYNTLAKVNPPLRSEKDRLSIIEGLRDGTIDVIATDHAPHTIDDKQREFNLAAFGINGLETAVMLTWEVLVNQEKFSPEEIGRLWSATPAQILGLRGGRIKEGAIADLTVIDPEYKWVIKDSMFYSKSKNSPFISTKGKGKAVITIVNGQVVWKERDIDING